MESIVRALHQIRSCNLHVNVLGNFRNGPSFFHVHALSIKRVASNAQLHATTSAHHHTIYKTMNHHFITPLMLICSLLSVSRSRCIVKEGRHFTCNDESRPSGTDQIYERHFSTARQLYGDNLPEVQEK